MWRTSDSGHQRAAGFTHPRPPVQRITSQLETDGLRQESVVRQVPRRFVALSARNPGGSPTKAGAYRDGISNFLGLTPAPMLYQPAKRSTLRQAVGRVSY